MAKNYSNNNQNSTNNGMNANNMKKWRYAESDKFNKQ